MSVPIKGWRSFELVIEFALATRTVARLGRVASEQAAYLYTDIICSCSLYMLLRGGTITLLVLVLLRFLYTDIKQLKFSLQCWCDCHTRF